MAQPECKPAEADLAAINQQPTEYTDGSVGVHAPFDCPVYVRVYRLMTDTREHDPKRRIFSQGLTGHTVQLDAFTFGVKVYLRIGRDGNLKVITEDSDGREVVAEWQK